MNVNSPPLANRLRWRPPTDDMRAEHLRSLAMGIEEALTKDARGVSFDRPLATLLSKALWDFADRLELMN